MNDASIQNSSFSIVEWNYTFTNGTVSNFCLPDNPTLDNTSIEYSGPGTYQVDLAIEDANGCVSSTSETITVYNNPTADFEHSTILCQDNPITFTDISTHGDGSLFTYVWDFGLGSSPPVQTNIENITYAFNGPKTIILEVTDDNSCSDTDTMDITISNLPSAIFEYTNVCAGDPVEFTNLSSPNDNPIASYQWILSDGYSTSDPSFSWIYGGIDSLVGAYVNAILTVTDDSGCTKNATANNLIEIHPLPIVDFTTNDPCEGQKFIFTNTSDINQTIFNDNLELSNSPNTQTWIYNTNLANTSSSLPTWEFTPPETAGIQTISLGQESSFISEYDNQHCSSILTQYPEILVMPKITFIDTSFNPLDKCGEGVIYTFDVTHNNNTVNTWKYEIDNTPIFIEDSSEDFVYEFNLPGIYNLTIDIHNNNGCSDTIPLKIHIYPDANASYTVNTNIDCEGIPLIFTDISSIPNNSLYNNGSSFISEWNWDYGDGTNYNYTTYIDEHNHIYNTFNGNDYYPSLTIKTDKGCLNTYFGDVITILTTPIAIIDSIIQVPAPEGNKGMFYFNGTNSTTSSGYTPLSLNDYTFNWFAEGSEVPQIPYTGNFTSWQFPTGDTDYDVILEITDNSNGCVSDTIASLYVSYFKGLQVPNALAPNGNTGEPSYFLPKGKSLKEYRLQIFDTWGNLVWETSAITVPDGKPVYPWKGETLDGKPLPQGTYIWKIYAKFTDGTVWPGINGETTGPIYLIR